MRIQALLPLVYLFGTLELCKSASGQGGGPNGPSGGGNSPPAPSNSGASRPARSPTVRPFPSIVSGGTRPPRLPTLGSRPSAPSRGVGIPPSSPSGGGGGGGPSGSIDPRSLPPSPTVNTPKAQPTPRPTVRPTVANCDKPVVKLETFLSVDGPGFPAKISQQDLDVLQVTFRNTYNFLSAFNCDSLHRRVEEVEIQVFDFPPSGDGAPVKVELIFRVEFSCQGERCSEQAEFFSLKKGFLGREDLASSLAQRRQGGFISGGNRNRDLKLDDLCQQCLTINPSTRSPTPRQFVELYRTRVEALKLATLGSVINVLEIEQKPCPGSYDTFNETVHFELDGDPNNVTDADLDLLGTTFLSSYNYYSDVQCDGRYLKVEQIEVFNDPIFTDPSVRHLATKVTYTFYLKAILTGTCKGCKDSKKLFTNDATKRDRFRRKLLERTGLRGHFVTHREFTTQLTSRQSRRTQQLIALPDFTLSEFRATMVTGCVSCPLPGASFFGSESCFCAKKGLDSKNETVVFDDAFNTTFSKEKGDNRYKGLQGYRGIFSGNKNGGSNGSSGGSGSGGSGTGGSGSGGGGTGGSGTGGGGTGGGGTGGSGSGGGGTGGSGTGGGGTGGSGTGGSGSGGSGSSRSISSNSFWG